MVTGFDLLHHNKHLQKHWVSRVIAFFIDLLISSMLVWVFFVLFSLGIFHYLFWYLPFAAGLFQVFYSAILEYWKGKTVGKLLLDLEIEPLRENLYFSETVIRNFSKIHGLFLLIDWVLGMMTEGDPRQRYLDRVADTTVIGGEEPKKVEHYIEEHLFKDEVETKETEEGTVDSGEEKRECRECGGELKDIGEGKARCTECGRIQ